MVISIRGRSANRPVIDVCRVVNAHPALLTSIREKKALDDDLKAEITKVISECKERFLAEQKG